MKRLGVLVVVLVLAILGGSVAQGKTAPSRDSTRAWWRYWWAQPIAKQAKIYWDPSWFSAYSIAMECSSSSAAPSFGPVRLYRGDDLSPSMTLPFVWRVGLTETQTCTLGTGIAKQVAAFRRGRVTKPASGTSPYIAGIECKHQTGLVSDQKIPVPGRGVRTLTVTLSQGDMCWAYGDDHDPWFESGHRNPAPYSLGSDATQCNAPDPTLKHAISEFQNQIVGFQGSIGFVGATANGNSCTTYFYATAWTRFRMLPWNDFTGTLSYKASNGAWSSGQSCVVFNGQMLSCQHSGSAQPPPLHSIVTLETSTSQGSSGTWAVEYDGEPPRPA